MKRNHYQHTNCGLKIMSILSFKPSHRIWAELSRGHYVHCRGLAGMIRKHGVELQQDRPTTAADGAVLLLWWPDRTQPVASGSTPIMRVNMQLATSPILEMEPPKLLKYVSGILRPRCLSAWERGSVHVYQSSLRLTLQDDLNFNPQTDKSP